MARGREPHIAARLHRPQSRPRRAGERVCGVRGVSAQVYASGRRLALGASATAAHWIGGECWFALGDGSVLIAPREGETRRIAAHEGAILCAAAHPDGRRLITGGDDGRLNIVAADGAELLADLRKWIEHVAVSAVSQAIVAGV